jgi:PPOX class probable F420-dependent enzyme
MPSFDPATTPYVSLETYRKSGVGVSTPVWVATLQERHYVFSETQAGKVKRIRNNPHVKIAACSYSGTVRSEWLSGRVCIVNEPTLVRRVYGEFTNKYGWQFRLTNVLSRLSGRYHQRAMLEISLDAV